MEAAVVQTNIVLGRAVYEQVIHTSGTASLSLCK